MVRARRWARSPCGPKRTRSSTGRASAAPIQCGALELGCGEGADAVWLAGQGWHVTAVDISATALARTSARAPAAGVAGRLTTQRHDLSGTFPSGTYDLISAQYLRHPSRCPAYASSRWPRTP